LHRLFVYGPLVSKNWKSLTALEHKQSLTSDALAPAYDADPGALVRLWFYYPQDGEKVALKLLSRPLYNDSVVWSFITDRLVKEKDPARSQDSIDEFRREHGLRYTETIPFLLRWIFWRTSFANNQEMIQGREVAAQILAKVYAGDDPNNPTLPGAVEPRQLMEMINAISPFPLTALMMRSIAFIVRSGSRNSHRSTIESSSMVSPMPASSDCTAEVTRT
jgi:hypothetical protein